MRRRSAFINTPDNYSRQSLTPPRSSRAPSVSAKLRQHRAKSRVPVVNTKKNYRLLKSFAVGSILMTQLICGATASGVSAKAHTQDVRIQGEIVAIERNSASTNAILADVVKRMEPALTHFLSTYSFTLLNSTETLLENKYRSKGLKIDWNISPDAKLFVAVKLSSKTYCYRGTGSYRIKLVKSSRCK